VDPRPLVNARFLVDALWTLRLAASVAQAVPGARGQVKRAVKAFGQALPGLQRIRNVHQHMDNYKTDHPTMRRQRLRANGKVIGRRLLEVDAWSNEGFSWLGEVVRFEEALAAAWDLVRVLRQVRDERTESD
jgi:hypothetical protein